MTRLLLFAFFALPLQLTAQSSQLRNDNFVYVDYIRSVRFHIDGLFLSLPILDLNAPSQLALSFDDLEGGVKDFTYTIIHCDIDWQPSNLSEMEYLSGFSEERIENYQFSFKTLTPYTHYRLLIPNSDLRWTKSGNYLLVVYEDGREKIPVITRRFVVAEPLVRITPNMVRPSQVSKMRTHQEFDFAVDHEKLDIRSPRQEIRAVVLQNGRWDNAITDLPPLFTQSTRMIFDYQDKVVFPGGKEFRHLDIRSLKFRSENLASLDRYDDRFEALLFKDQKRFDQVYLDRRDINGNFVIETFDQRDPDLSSEYIYVLFTLYSPTPYFDEELYLVGRLSDWQLLPEFRMAYNNSVNGYVAKVLLKQGVYDYAYAVVPRNTKKPSLNLSEIEGDWHETENEYTILIYYRPFGERYDRLIGAVTFGSRIGG